MDNIKKIQIVCIMCLCFVVFLFTMIFAFYTDQLNKSNSSNKNKSCHLVFSNLSITNVGDSSYKVPTLFDNSLNNFQITLNKVGDKVTFRFKINNDGSLPCQIRRIKEAIYCDKGENGEHKEICNSMRYSLQYENGDSVYVGDGFLANSSYNVKLVIEYPSNYDDDDVDDKPVIINGNTLKIYYKK